jgi:hypothetical protein
MVEEKQDKKDEDEGWNSRFIELSTSVDVDSVFSFTVA